MDGVYRPLPFADVALVVQKFGGTSVADPDRMREVAAHVKRCRARGDDVVLVVSAMGKETDELLRLVDEVTDDPPGRELDMLITAGVSVVACEASGGGEESAAEASSMVAKDGEDVRARRPTSVPSLDATRGHLTRSWVVSFPISRLFGPRRATATAVESRFGPNRFIEGPETTHFIRRWPRIASMA